MHVKYAASCGLRRGKAVVKLARHPPLRGNYNERNDNTKGRSLTHSLERLTRGFDRTGLENQLGESKFQA